MRSHRKIVFVLLGVIAAMVALSYASVPLYRIFCQATGWGGTTNTSIVDSDAPVVATPAPSVPAVQNDMVTVRFDATTSPELDWEFKAPEPVTIKLGERHTVMYAIKNISNRTITGRAVHNVTPVQAGQYFHRIKCFCDENKTLKPGETMDLPVLFSVDLKIKHDDDLQSVKTITLSYSYFKAK